MAHLSRILLTLSFFCLPVSTWAQNSVSIKFSVYLIPSVRKDANENFERIKDVHYAYGEKNIPLSLKEARQSMAYPYVGPDKLTLFHVKTIEGEDTRVPLCSTKIPSGAKKGIILVSRGNDGRFAASSHWFGNKEMQGGGRIYNLSGLTVALEVKGRKNALIIQPTEKKSLQAEFKDKSGYGYIAVTGYTQEKAEDGTMATRKAMSKNFVFKQDDAHLVIILSKLRYSLQSRCLSANGVPNKRALKELQKDLPLYMKTKTSSDDRPAQTPAQP